LAIIMANNDKVEMKGVVGNLHHYVFHLEECGSISVYLQGDLEKQREGVVFMTLHDVGHSYLSLVDFVNHPEMEEIRRRCMFMHVVMPGQEPGAAPLSDDYIFPSMQDLGLNLVTVLDLLRVSQVVLLGEGAGANIFMRFAICHPTRVHGLVAVNCTADASQGKFIDIVKEKIKKSEAKSLHKRNVEEYAEAFRNRTEVTSTLHKLKVDVLLLTGTKSGFAQDTENIHRELKPGICSIIKVDDSKDVLEDAACKAADAIILFCQGQSLLPTAQRRMSRQNSSNNSNSSDTRKKSMSEYDTPNIRRLSLTSH